MGSPSCEPFSHVRRVNEALCGSGDTESLLVNGGVDSIWFDADSSRLEVDSASLWLPAGSTEVAAVASGSIGRRAGESDSPSIFPGDGDSREDVSDCSGSTPPSHCYNHTVT